MANIELVDLTKHYKQGKTVVRALDGVTLSITAGEFVSVVGRSGSGKTTLLDLVGLLLRPTSGRVVIDGVDTSTLKDGQRADTESLDWIPVETSKPRSRLRTLWTKLWSWAGSSRSS